MILDSFRYYAVKVVIQFENLNLQYKQLVDILLGQL